jgi:hypothetical protein
MRVDKQLVELLTQEQREQLTRVRESLVNTIYSPGVLGGEDERRDLDTSPAARTISQA